MAFESKIADLNRLHEIIMGMRRRLSRANSCSPSSAVWSPTWLAPCFMISWLRSSH